jgi:hypothetical protein
MVVIEDLLNNIKRKVYGRPVEVSPNAVYYCVIEEEEFSGVGDCIQLQSSHRIQRGIHFYNDLESKSIIPIWLDRDSYQIDALGEPVKYITFFLPERLKLNLSTQRLENQVGLVFNEQL